MRWVTLFLFNAGAIAIITASAQTPQFRSTVTGVGVPVVVRAGGDPVHNLTSQDFVLTDSGVVQEIIALDAASVPLDLTVVAAEINRTSQGWKTLEAETAAVAAALRREDRFSMVLAGRDPRSFTLPGPENLADQLTRDRRCWSVYDALVRVDATDNARSTEGYRLNHG